MKDVDKLIEGVLADFNPKQRKVVEGRFALRGGGRATLQEIGDNLGITRERVRQIEAMTLNRLKDRLRNEAEEILGKAKAYLAGAGGVRRDDLFVRDLKQIFGTAEKKLKNADEKLRFIFWVTGSPFYHRDDEDFYPFWYVDENSNNKFLNFSKKIRKTLETANKQEALSGKLYLAECKDCASYHLLTIAKNFGMSVFGDFGLRSWPEIEPKTIKDKAYLVLKKHGLPLHFSEIAKNITQFGLAEKAAHIQTVHNELIKDGRFVLVGRGMYALGEHGYEPGTVKEVIAKLLKRQGPLNSNEVVRLVNQQRILKENTILLSLQNRRHFKRLEDGRYHIRQA